LGVGAIIGAASLVLSGLGAHYAGTGPDAFLCAFGARVRVCGLCYAEFAAMIRWLAARIHMLTPRWVNFSPGSSAGPHAGIRHGASTVSSGWSNHFIELLNIFKIKMPLWLAYDHWTGLSTATKIIARQMAQASDTTLQPGTQAFLDKIVGALSRAVGLLNQFATALMMASTLSRNACVPGCNVVSEACLPSGVR